MEGGGEGMVAIVQGLKDAGLTVTLVDGRYDQPTRLASARTCRDTWLPQAKSSVETSTDAIRSHAGAQICDEQYTSSYQLAHCSMKPTSPAVHLPEFPLQKQERYINHGNFDVRWQTVQEYPHRLKTTQLPRNSFTYTNQEVASCSRSTDAFVHSLRRYPSLSPVGTPSSDLVCKLIAYTEAKNDYKIKCNFAAVQVAVGSVRVLSVSSGRTPLVALLVDQSAV
ncbi:uncharacterized protein LOC131852196 [Achroia grisella]|uniref:uncharacterized protein LOC131852196 n=1 Tax=Achroia grisella TaxID=688607 RepID=UPI0027D24B77|nr:uncharacterized protein LOC131852196 [Achroia grisella]